MSRLSSGESSSTRRTSTNKSPTDQTKTSRLSGRFYAFRLLLGLTVFSIASSAARGADFYVSPSGSTSGNGSVTSPWSLAAALAQPAAVKPGDTIWLRGGTYQGTFWSNLNGTASAPIIVRQYPGEGAIIDGGDSNFVNILNVAGSYTWYWGFEIMSSDPNRVSTQIGSNPTDIGRGGGVAIVQTSDTGAGLKFINLIVHDAAGGFGLWAEAIDAEVYGCLVYYNGWTAPDRGHGHGFYVQNLTGTKRIADNIVFSNFSHGIQVYGSAAAALNNVTIQGNTFFNSAMPDYYQRNVLVGGGSVAQNPRIIDNVIYYPGTTGQNLNVGYEYGVGVNNAVITGNYVVNSENAYFSPLNTNVTMTGNSFYTPVDSSTQTLFSSNIYSSSRPTTAQIFIRPNQYEPGRAHITVVNWGNAASVSVNLSSLLAAGASYEIRNAQNFFASPVLSGIYSGGSVSLPMTGLSPATPYGYSAPPATGPQFEVFVVLTTSGPPGGPSPTATRTPTPTPTRTSTTPTPTATTRTPTPTLQTPTPTPTRAAQPILTPTPTPTKPGLRKGNPH